jgi:hypothetical protein
MRGSSCMMVNAAQRCSESGSGASEARDATGTSGRGGMKACCRPYTLAYCRNASAYLRVLLLGGGGGR